MKKEDFLALLCGGHYDANSGVWTGCSRDKCGSGAVEYV